MALRLSKRKRPAREDKPLKEATKIASRIFDPATLMVLVKLINTKVLKSLDYPVAHGKEAVVFRGTAPDGTYVAVKVYKYETTSFRTMERYIEGDPRFVKAKRSLRALIKQWAQKEFSNLQACQAAGVHSPKPIICKENVVVMEFLGEGGLPYPILRQVKPEQPESLLNEILLDVRALYQAGFVHADLSPYNLLYDGEHAYLIDVSQTVLRRHPKANEFLEHDVDTVLRYFAKQGATRDLGETLAWIRESKDSR